MDWTFIYYVNGIIFISLDVWHYHLFICEILQVGPDYPMCTVCPCTWGLTTLEAPRPSRRENCHAKFCDWGVDKCIEI